MKNINPYVYAGLGHEPKVGKHERKQFIYDTIRAEQGISEKVLNSKSRKREVVYTRQLIMYFLIKHKFTTSTAAKKVNREHATAIHARMQIETLMETEPHIKKQVESLARYFKKMTKETVIELDNE